MHWGKTAKKFKELNDFLRSILNGSRKQEVLFFSFFFFFHIYLLGYFLFYFFLVTEPFLFLKKK